MQGVHELSVASDVPLWVRQRNEELWCMVDAVEDAAQDEVDYRQLAVLE